MELQRDGAELTPVAVGEAHRKALVSMLDVDPNTPGRRLIDRPDLGSWLNAAGINEAASSRLSGEAHPVRAIWFDKSDHANWSLGWHQDRTIAVAARAEAQGFEHWTVKGGIQHVEPPFRLIERMITVRIHLDNVPSDNGPLLILPGSHRLGKLDENALSELTSRVEAVACLAREGDIWWYRTPIVHASARAAPGRRRRVLQIDYSADPLPPTLQWRGIA